ncbi:hypothetical protein CCACVL1_29790 [Corchorus capsularis]|uniref:Uncharacterized protein n=1 Tax=Corchorus capsularis TaxID=210143 RepID=A0A1R3G051_COCAP|nr:hypothetical protein CCACVL1_29790 [Corchorus capsularis]
MVETESELGDSLLMSEDVPAQDLAMFENFLQQQETDDNTGMSLGNDGNAFDEKSRNTPASLEGGV